MERGVRLSQVGYIKSRQLLFVYTAVEDITAVCDGDVIRLLNVGGALFLVLRCRCNICGLLNLCRSQLMLVALILFAPHSCP